MSSASDPDCSTGVAIGNVFLPRKAIEPIPAFLARLVPTQTACTQGAWIYIDNPCPPDPSCGRPNWNQAVHAATHILSTLAGQLAASPTPTVTRQRQLHQSTTQALKHVATRYSTTIGKWILFYPRSQIDLAWSRIATATALGSLGVAAKVNTTTPAHADGSRSYVICVYTYDFNDRVDVQRVLVELYRLGLTPPGFSLHDVGRSVDNDRLLPSHSCTWKPDLYTELGIDSGNPWGLAPTLYRWQEFLPPKSATSSSDNERASESLLSIDEQVAAGPSKRSKSDEKVVMMEGVDF